MLPVVGGAILLADVETAEAAERHKVVFYTEGGRGAEVTGFFKEALPPNIDVVPSAQFTGALLKRGQRTPLGLTVTLPTKRSAMPQSRARHRPPRQKTSATPSTCCCSNKPSALKG